MSKITTKTVVSCGLMTALAVVMARFLAYAPTDSVRISLESIPVFLAGFLFGPLAGVLVGFAQDFLGCLFSPYGYNVLFCVPPILYGLCGGLFAGWIRSRRGLWRVAAAYLPAVLLGSLLYQSLTLAALYGKGDTLWISFLTFLSARSVQFAVIWVADSLLTWLLIRADLEKRLKL